MTSSLVGSEMCIRDRYYTHRTSPTGSLTSTSSTTQPRALTSISFYGKGSVSYTHLTLPTICSV
eukprot:6347891-Prorocentrum_lima.AAC.1